MDDVYRVKEEIKEEEMRVEYTRPKFWHRCVANFVDFFIFAIVFLFLFIGTRAAVQATPPYKVIKAQLYDIQLRSGIYREPVADSTTTDTIDIVFYIDNYKKGTPAGDEFDIDVDDKPMFINGMCVKTIKIFINFCHENCSYERYQDLLVYYDEARLNATIDGLHFFILDDENNVVPNPTVKADKGKLRSYYTDVFKPFIEKRCIPFLSANVPGYHNLIRTDYRLLILLELPVSYVLAGILVYFVPPLFFRRGRKTLGKALYHIGLIDQRLLSPTVPRFLMRFVIFLFGELILSMFSFGIPYIISFSMMAFSKKKQGFPDFMVRTLEVDTSKANIYLDYVEAVTKNQIHGEAIDFKLEKPL